ncbi:MAG TPA: DUF6519 domain-containing protein [Candidatus Angelobacter sp.]|nr:DUF6519 domain-containing protein [Candidatus Angelobacter sp.]
MGSDRARISFDPSRDYRSVVAQQGRVTLEADINEQASIASEALRRETVDVVGPSGTPDDGYKVSLDGSGNPVIGRGTMYLGGWRLNLPSAVPINQQPDWLDRPQVSTKPPEMVALLVTEQEVSAIEDQALREVALGGPDTAARSRLMQHFLCLPSDSTCPAAEKALTAQLKQMGLQYNNKTDELAWDANLKVSFYPPATPVDPCCPPAQGGYLGADNQLVQVTVAAFDSASHTGTLLWGWNNASFIYRAAIVDPGANPPVLTLDPRPVDAEHTPQPGQVIEVLRTTCVLGNAADKIYIAAPQGLVVTLGSGTVFDPDTKQLTLPSGTTVPSDPNSLFVRLWQAEVPFTSGTAVQLDPTSGLAVTVTLNALPTGQFLARPFWEFAVRPNTPQKVYPERYLQSGSAPDGPRQWLCNLAVIVPGAPPQDCRNHFLPLIDLEPCDCCHLVLDPAKDWLGALNNALASNATALSICFQPGQFMVTSKIAISGKSVKMTGAGKGTSIVGRALEVVLEFDNCPCVELSSLSVTAGTAGFSNNPATAGLQGAVTMRSCAEVDVERVWLTCADADLRAASCLAIYNPAPASSNLTLAPQFNVRVLNSQFMVGHFQVGILLVNADRAQIEGNLIVTPQTSRNLGLNDIAKRTVIADRIKKQLVHALTITDTAPSRRTIIPADKKQLKAASVRTKPLQPAKTAPKAEQTPAAGGPASPATPATPGGTPAPPNTAPGAAGAPAPPTPAQPGAPPETGAGPTKTPAITDQGPRINLGSFGLQHVTATFGTVKLQFISSEKLGNAWLDALRTSGLTESSGVKGVHKAIKKIATTVVRSPNTVAPAFKNFLTATLPLLYSTSSQGIVVGGDVAKDIRILNNTINGSAQGIHVGLSNLKTKLHQRLIAGRVQICGNTITIRVTPETTGDRHGIYVGSVVSAIINDNQLELLRAFNPKETKQSVFPGQITWAIKVAGQFGPRMLIERNCMLQFSGGILTLPYSVPETFLWKTSDNASSSKNSIVQSFIQENNILP